MYIFIILLSLFIIVQDGFFPSKRKDVPRIIDIAFVIIIVLVGTFRDTCVGSDIVIGAGGYYDFWKNPSGDERDLEPGFKCFTYFVISLLICYSEK